MALPAELALLIEGHASALRVTALEGREALCALFELTVTLACDEALGAIGRRASLHLMFGSRSRTIHGIVRALEQGEAPGLQRATLAPAAYVLALREDCRIFQGRRAPDIIESVLIGAGLSGRDYRLALHEVYRPREHTTQYRETDWSFLMRLLESEGMYCFFEQGEEREVLVFADAPLAHRRMSAPDSLPFRPGGGALLDDERVDRFVHHEQLRAGRVSLRGHSFQHPCAPLQSDAAGDREGVCIYDAPPEYDAPELGERLARLRLEREAFGAASARASSDSLGVAPGVVFELSEHSTEALNRDWLVTSVEHRVSADGGEPRYGNRFSCLAADVPYRPPLRTPKPSIGMQTAVVVGPAGQDVHCDDLGRVKVQFRWDREGNHDEHSSSWLRVSQAWAGPGYGALFIPRVGHDVLVDFADGDPDRPIVVGSVYHAVNLPPASLPRQRTATVLRASSTPGGEGASELRMEAQRGLEHVYLQSWRDLNVRVGQNKDEVVTGSERLRVGGERDRSVAGGEKVEIAGSQRLSVGTTRVDQVALDETRSIGGKQMLGVAGDRTSTVTGNDTEIVGRDLTLRVAGDKAETVRGSSREVIEGAHALEAQSLALEVIDEMRVEVEGEHLEQAGSRRIEAGEMVELICGEATITAHKDGTITLVGKRVRLKVAGPIEVEGHKLSVKSRGAVNVKAGGQVRLRGPGVNLN